jgi:hypothetical protein
MSHGIADALNSFSSLLSVILIAECHMLFYRQKKSGGKDASPLKLYHNFVLNKPNSIANFPC